MGETVNKTLACGEAIQVSSFNNPDVVPSFGSLHCRLTLKLFIVVSPIEALLDLPPETAVFGC